MAHARRRSGESLLRYGGFPAGLGFGRVGGVLRESAAGAHGPGSRATASFAYLLKELRHAKEGKPSAQESDQS